MPLRGLDAEGIAMKHYTQFDTEKSRAIARRNAIAKDLMDYHRAEIHASRLYWTAAASILGFIVLILFSLM
jgi:hypothetical protein